jgi:hypothetical protein
MRFSHHIFEVILQDYKYLQRAYCNAENATVFEHMIGFKMFPINQFYNNTMETLSYLNTLLPPESHVILMGLIDGSILYKAMAKRFHPLGELRGDLVRCL